MSKTKNDQVSPVTAIKSETDPMLAMVEKLKTTIGFWKEKLQQLAQQHAEAQANLLRAEGALSVLLDLTKDAQQPQG